MLHNNKRSIDEWRYSWNKTKQRGINLDKWNMRIKNTKSDNLKSAGAVKKKPLESQQDNKLEVIIRHFHWHIGEKSF